jgi:hypothetical protein
VGTLNQAQRFHEMLCVRTFAGSFRKYNFFTVAIFWGAAPCKEINTDKRAERSYCAYRQGVTSQKTASFLLATMRTLDLTK